MAEEEEKKERIITVPLRYPHSQPRTKRTRTAVRFVREHVGRHMKVPTEKVWIDPIFNEVLWERGRQKPPTKIKVKAEKFWDQKRSEWYVEVTVP
ncbi:MAG: 50S ribosomal protein L31e [Thermoplasmatota archaeon]